MTKSDCGDVYLQSRLPNKAGSLAANSPVPMALLYLHVLLQMSLVLASPQCKSNTGGNTLLQMGILATSIDPWQGSQMFAGIRFQYLSGFLLHTCVSKRRCIAKTSLHVTDAFVANVIMDFVSHC